MHFFRQVKCLVCQRISLQIRDAEAVFLTKQLKTTRCSYIKVSFLWHCFALLRFLSELPVLYFAAFDNKNNLYNHNTPKLSLCRKRKVVKEFLQKWLLPYLYNYIFSNDVISPKVRLFFLVHVFLSLCARLKERAAANN